MSDYNLRPGGPLKLKGVIDGHIVKKKKKRKAPKEVSIRLEDEQQGTQIVTSGGEEGSGSTPGSGRNSPAVVGGSRSHSSRQTPAERHFSDMWRKRLRDKAAKSAGKSHKDHVLEFNAKLEALSEHHDIPKVGPG